MVELKTRFTSLSVGFGYSVILRIEKVNVKNRNSFKCFITLTL